MAMQIVAERPTNIPTEWIIMRCDTHIVGHIEWQEGDMFFAGISPVLKEGHCVELNQKQGAVILEYVSIGVNNDQVNSL